MANNREALLGTICALLLAYGISATVWGLDNTNRATALKGENLGLTHEVQALHTHEEELAARHQAELEAERKSAIAKAQVAEQRALEHERKSNDLLMTQQERLHEVLPGLRKLAPGSNRVDLGYVKSFERMGETYRLTLTNDSSAAVKPNFTISFLDGHGFVVDSCAEAWMFESIAPGETRVLNHRVSNYFGQPVYFLPRVQ